MDTAFSLAASIAAKLGAVPGVVAVVLGGSRARGTADPDSDIDLGIYYDPDNRPALDDLRAVAARLDDSHNGEVVTDFGGWGPWINGGGWLTIDGQRVDWLYRDIQQVRQVIDECRAGNPRIFYQAGHPHGFWTTIYMGEIHLCKPLHDPTGVLDDLKKLTTPYPPLLKKAMIERNLWEATFALDTSRKSAARRDTFYVMGSLFRCAACLAQVVYALNGRYCINEKGAVKEADSFPILPQNWRTTIASSLGGGGRTPSELTANLDHMAALVDAVRVLVER